MTSTAKQTTFLIACMLLLTAACVYYLSLPYNPINDR